MEVYYYIIIPLLAMIFAQLIKFTIESIRERRLKWARLFNGCGGMPSTHTSTVFALITCMGLGEGFDSPFFAISLFFGMIVAYDSMGVRRESEKQAIMINRIFEDFLTKDASKTYKKLKEELGHDPIEVFAGILFGIGVAALLMQFV